VLSRHVTVRNISIENPVGSNADGVDPEACDHVLIENCRFDTGDDCISLKSGRNQEGRRLATPCQNVVISGCEFSSERSALSCGSESSGGIRQVFIDNVTAGRIFRLFRIKTNSQRGGVNEHIYLRGATVEAALENLVEIQTNFSEPLKDGPAGSAPAPHFPVIRDISFENIETGPVYRAFNLAGSTETPIQRLMLRNIRIETVQNPDRVAHVPDPTVERVTVGGRAITLA
jgi:polygalacturonase